MINKKDGNSLETLAESDGDHHDVPPRFAKIMLFIKLCKHCIKKSENQVVFALFNIIQASSQNPARIAAVDLDAVKRLAVIVVRMALLDVKPAEAISRQAAQRSLNPHRKPELFRIGLQI